MRNHKKTYATIDNTDPEEPLTDHPDVCRVFFVCLFALGFFEVTFVVRGGEILIHLLAPL
jgi:hypothetical protein